jgi:hypothetical protein
LAELPWVTQTHFTPYNDTSICQIGVSDEAAAEANLLRFVLYDPDVTVTQFSRKKHELEEVFMEIIKGDNHVR